MRKRYRYILNGLALGDDKLCNFRLIAGNNIKSTYDGSVALRVNIPNDVELTKYAHNPYSTTNDERTLNELGYDVLIWKSESKKWEIHNEFKGMKPCDIHLPR